MKKYPYAETLPVFGYQFAVCFTLKQLQQLNPLENEFLPDNCCACVDSRYHKSSIMCVDVDQAKSTGDLINSLAHESTHIWQAICKSIGEETPGDETAAYHIGHITQRAFEWYEDHMKKTKEAEEKKAKNENIEAS